MAEQDDEMTPAPVHQAQAGEQTEPLATGQAQAPPQPVPESDQVVSNPGNTPAADKVPAALVPDELSAGPTEQPSNTPQGQAPPAGEGQEAAVPGQDTDAAVAPVGELRITWQQKGDEVAPLLEMRAYLDQLREAGVAVGALQFERNPVGKLTGGFAVSYDPESNKLGQLEATLQGLRQVGHGVAVVEKPEQAAARRQEAGYDDGYEPPRSKQVRQAFGADQWDALSAQLAAVPRHALTVPEQGQQAAAEQRVQQLAQRQGKTTEQVLRDGKSIFDIDTSGNPASAFLKNFYAHLNGGPKTRQHLEVDYEQTRQDLQARLLRKAGTAQAEVIPDQAPAGPSARVVAVADAGKPAPAERVTPPAPVATPFQARDVPQQVLASLGLTLQALEQSGQLEKLLSGRQTDLLAMQVTGRPDQDPVRFEGKMVLHREADGTATLKMALPQARLVIPNEIGGLPFTPEQRQRLETEGNAGLLRGLKDEQGRAYNGYVAVDKTMNKVVILPEDKVTLHDTIAGVKLTPEQSHDLREGKVVALAGMASGDGGRQFDGTVQVNAAKACIEVRPAAHEMVQRQAPQVQQTVPAATKTVEATPVKAQTAQVKTRGPRHRAG